MPGSSSLGGCLPPCCAACRGSCCSASEPWERDERAAEERLRHCTPLPAESRSPGGSPATEGGADVASRGARLPRCATSPSSSGPASPAACRLLV